MSEYKRHAGGSNELGLTTPFPSDGKGDRLVGKKQDLVARRLHEVAVDVDGERAFRIGRVDGLDLDAFVEALRATITLHCSNAPSPNEGGESAALTAGEGEPPAREAPDAARDARHPSGRGASSEP